MSLGVKWPHGACASNASNFINKYWVFEKLYLSHWPQEYSRLNIIAKFRSRRALLLQFHPPQSTVVSHLSRRRLKEGGLRLAPKVAVRVCSPKICIFQNALTFLFFKVMRSKFEDFFVSSWNWENKRIRARIGRAKVALSTFIWKIVILRFKSFSYPEFQTVQRTTKDQKSPEIDGAQFFLHR